MRVRQVLFVAAVTVSAGAIALMGVPAQAMVAGTPLPARDMVAGTPLPARDMVAGTPLPAKGEVTEIRLPARSVKTTLGEIQAVINRNVKEKIELPEAVAVVTDTGKPLTDEQITTLVTGKDVDGIRVLNVVKNPSGGSTLGDLANGPVAQKKITFSGSKGPVKVTVTVTADCSLSSMSCTVDIDIKVTVKP